MMAFWHACLLVCVLSKAIVANAASGLRFANYYGDHMVLQRAPASAVVWGYVPECETVSVEFNSVTLKADLAPGDGTCHWKVVLSPTDAGGPHTITASSENYGNASLQDVLFGDVWICSGQSNMQFTVPQVFNASIEITKADRYPNIRLFTTKLIASEVPKEELMGILQPWQVASAAAVNGSAWGYFSATCWFFGVNLYDSIQVPLGLVATSWGGTRIEAWSSLDALNKCPMDVETRDEQLVRGIDPNSPSVLWNSMMYPFTNMTIFGAIWYQGEANAGGYRTEQYACTFPAMITDWREKWHQNTGGQTDPMFPFGFVQLAAYGSDNKTAGGFPVIRWAQTANYGYVPNVVLQKVFMAVATDLGDPTSPYGSIHPRDKEDVGARLVLAAAAVAYNNEAVYYTGPIATKTSVTGLSEGTVQAEVTFKNVPEAIVLRSKYGFELGCVNANDSQWLEGTITSMGIGSAASVSIEFPACPVGYSMKQIRYDWRQDPCVFKQCAVYSKELPSPPFIMDVAVDTGRL